MTAVNAVLAATRAAMAMVDACCDPSVVGSRSTEGAMHITVTLNISRHAITNWNRVTRKRSYFATNAASSKRGEGRVTIQRKVTIVCALQRPARSPHRFRAALRERSIQICPRGRHSAAEPTRLDSAP